MTKAKLKRGVKKYRDMSGHDEDMSVPGPLDAAMTVTDMTMAEAHA